MRTRLAAMTLALAAACASVPPTEYAAFRAHLPASILVLPPLNETTDVTAPYDWLSTITRPLAEAGYYVFPVAVVDAFMKENGLPTPGEMHAVPLARIRDVLGADAVLYATIHDWGQKYRVVTSDTVVRVSMRLVDVGTGTTLWIGEALAQRSSAAGQGDPIGMLLSALLSQVVASVTDPAHELGRAASAGGVGRPHDGFLLGRRHPRFDQDARGR